MYELEYIRGRYCGYSEKYNVNVRIDNLLSSYYSGLKTILYITGNFYNQSIRYRVDHVLDIIERIEDWYGLKMESINIPYIMPYLSFIDVIVFHRTYYSEVKEVVFLAKKYNIPMYFDIDDYAFHEQCLEEAIKATSVTKTKRQKMIEEYLRVEENCEAFITSNSFLKHEIEILTGKEAFVVRNFLNQEEMRVAKNYFIQKNQTDRYVPMFAMGYFSGSTGHNKDFELIADSIEHFMNIHEDTCLKVVGFLELPKNLLRYKECGRIVIKPFMDSCDLLKEIAEIDVNLIPLKINKFTQSRSEIKYFDAAIVGTISCMAPTEIYKEMIEKGNCGYVCENKEWEETLEKIYGQKEEMYKDFGKLYQEAESRFAFSHQKQQIEKLLLQLKACVD